MTKKPEICVFCERPIKTGNSLVRLYFDGDCPVGHRDGMADGGEPGPIEYAHRRCATKEGLEELPGD